MYKRLLRAWQPHLDGQRPTGECVEPPPASDNMRANLEAARALEQTRLIAKQGLHLSIRIGLVRSALLSLLRLRWPASGLHLVPGSLVPRTLSWSVLCGLCASAPRRSPHVLSSPSGLVGGDDFIEIIMKSYRVSFHKCPHFSYRMKSCQAHEIFMKSYSVKYCFSLLCCTSTEYS